MAPKRLRLELISNKKKQHETFEKRTKGLEKKASELSTLCGVKICMIMYGPEEQQRKEPLIWPRNYTEVAELIDSYQAGSKDGRGKREYNVSSFLNEQSEKVEEEIKKVRGCVKEVKYPKWDKIYNSLSYEELKEFDGKLSAKIDYVKARIGLMKNFSRFLYNESSSDVLVNSSIQENSSFFMPIQQQSLLYYDDYAQAIMPNVIPYSCNNLNWIGDMNNNLVQNFDLGTGMMMMEEYVKEPQPLMYYSAPNEIHVPEQMLWRNFMNAAQGGVYGESSDFSMNY